MFDVICLFSIRYSAARKWELPEVRRLTEEVCFLFILLHSQNLHFIIL